MVEEAGVGSEGADEAESNSETETTSVSLIVPNSSWISAITSHSEVDVEVDLLLRKLRSDRKLRDERTERVVAGGTGGGGATDTFGDFENIDTIDFRLDTEAFLSVSKVADETLVCPSTDADAMLLLLSFADTGITTLGEAKLSLENLGVVR